MAATISKRTDMTTLFEQDYDAESLYDLGRDIGEAVDGDYNPEMAKIPVNEDGFQTGTFKVKIEWIPPTPEKD